MHWDENTPISPANLNDMEQRIAQALANVENGKAIIAAAIQAMGQSAGAGDEFAQLGQKIRDISKDANATAAQVSAGRTFYQGGVKRTGTMPNRGNVSVTLTQQGQEYTIPDGQHGGSGKVKAQFANLVPPNVTKGASVGGVVGTAPRTAAGSAVADSSGIVTVTGIPWINNNCAIAVRGGALRLPNWYYRQVVYGSGHRTLHYRMITGSRHWEGPSDGGSFSLVKLPSPITVNPGVGFTCPGFEAGESYQYVVTEDAL